MRFQYRIKKRRSQILRIILILFIFPAFQGISLEANGNDSIKSLFSGTANPEEKLTLLLTMAEKETDAKLAVDFAESAVNLADSLRLTFQKAEALHLSGVAWKNWGDYLKSADQLSEALEIFKQAGSERNAAIVKRDLGETYRAGRGYTHSMFMLNEALKFFMRANDTIEIAKTYNRLAATQFELLPSYPHYQLYIERIGKTRDKFQEVLRPFPELKGGFDTLDLYCGKAMNLSRKKKLHDIMISTWIIKAAFSRLTHSYEATLQKYDSIINEINVYGVYRELPLVLYNKSLLLGTGFMGQPEKSLVLAGEMLQLARKNNTRRYEFMAYELMHMNYKALGNYEQAYFYFMRNQVLFEHFLNDDLLLKLKSQQYSHQMLARDMEIRSRRRQTIMLILSFSCIVVVLSVFSIGYYRKNQKQKKLLQELNNKNEIILKQNEDLQMVNAEKTKFFSIIGHDLKSPFNAIMGFSELLMEDIRENNLEDIEKYAGFILQASHKSMDLLTNLMIWTRSQTGRLEFNPEPIDLADLADKNMMLLSEPANNKSIELHNQIAEGFSVVADREMLGLVLRNLVSNAVKFTRTGGVVTIDAKNENGKTIIAVKDNGIGMSRKLISDLFSLNADTGRRGTNDEESTGLGLILCKEFVEKHGGAIAAESIEGTGSTFAVTLPCS